MFQGCGTVFELTPSPGIAKASIVPWNEIVLHLFTGGSDGGNPQGNLTFDQSGNMYGTAGGGGNQNCWGGSGSFTSLALLTEVGQRPFFILSKVRTTE